MPLNATADSQTKMHKPPGERAVHKYTQRLGTGEEGDIRPRLTRRSVTPLTTALLMTSAVSPGGQSPYDKPVIDRASSQAGLLQIPTQKGALPTSGNRPRAGEGKPIKPRYFLRSKLSNQAAMGTALDLSYQETICSSKGVSGQPSVAVRRSPRGHTRCPITETKKRQVPGVKDKVSTITTGPGISNGDWTKTKELEVDLNIGRGEAPEKLLRYQRTAPKETIRPKGRCTNGIPLDKGPNPAYSNEDPLDRQINPSTSRHHVNITEDALQESYLQPPQITISHYFNEGYHLPSHNKNGQFSLDNATTTCGGSNATSPSQVVLHDLVLKVQGRDRKDLEEVNPKMSPENQTYRGFPSATSQEWTISAATGMPVLYDRCVDQLDIDDIQILEIEKYRFLVMERDNARRLNAVFYPHAIE